MTSHRDRSLDELLGRIERREQSARKKALLWTMLPVAAAVVLLSVTFWQIREATRTVQELEEKRTSLQAALGAITERLQTQNEQIEVKRAELERITAELEQAQETLDYVGLQLATERIPEAREALTRADTEVVDAKPRIYIHVRSEAQLTRARKLASLLEADGYLVPKAEILVDTGPGQTQVRYFRENERDEAAEVARILQSEGVSADVRYIGGYESSKLVKPRQFEIWLAADLS